MATEEEQRAPSVSLPGDWRLFECTDCPEGETFQLAHPVEEGVSHEQGCAVEYCPSCGSYLSLVQSRGRLSVSRTR